MSEIGLEFLVSLVCLFTLRREVSQRRLSDFNQTSRT